MGILKPLALAMLAACYAPDIPDCARTDSCAQAAGVDATAPPADARPARPDASPSTIMVVVHIDGRGDVHIPSVGTCSAGNGTAVCPFVVAKGVLLSIGAVPKNNWRFDRWDDACSGTLGATCELTPTATTSVRVRFEED
jgi:Divergent InlB B-repeat domain